MAIDAYVGKPRSGKSYSVVKNVILPSLREGREVYTNIPLTQAAHDEFPGMIHQFESEWYKDPEVFSRIPNGSVVVADEVWRRWPKGMQANKIPQQDKAFLAEHGHLVGDNGKTTRVVLVTQDLDQLSNFCLTLIDKTYQSVKLDAVGASSKFRIDIYSGSAKGERPPKSRLIRSTFDSYSKKYWVYYKSATLSETDDVGDESRADKRTSVWRSPFMWFAIIAPFTIGPLGIWYLVGLFGSGFGAVKEAPVEAKPVAPRYSQAVPASPAVHSPAPAANVEPTEEKPKEVLESQRWRISGYVQRSVQPADQHWPSEVGYGVQRPVRTLRLTQSFAVLHDGGSNRYIPLSECQPEPGGVDYTCIVDGSIVSRWSGPRGSNVADSVLGSVPFVGGERSEQARATAPSPGTQPAAQPAASLQRSPQPITTVGGGNPGHLW